MAENQQILTTSQRQEQQLSVRQLQSLELLNMPMLELQERLTQELAANPVLEMDSPPEEELPPAPENNEKGSGDDDDWSVDAVESELWNDDLPLPGESESHDRSGEIHDYILGSLRSAPPSLADQLESELATVGNLDENLRRAAEEIISSLDDNGYLTTHPADIAMYLDLPMETVEKALTLVQGFDPPGIGCRNLAECLKIQLKRRGEDTEELFRILDSHLEDIEQNRLPQLARKLGITLDELNDDLAILRKLNPYPGRIFGNDSAEFILPELAIVEEDGAFRVQTRSQAFPRLFLAERYVRMLDDPSLNDADRAYLKEKIQSARELMRSFDLRQSTLVRIAQMLIATQEPFFRHGVEALRPLTMREAGEQLQLHETTISRAVANKYIETPQGILPLKFFFSAGVTGENGENISNRAVKEKIRELIQSEDPTKPRSDEQLSKLLKEQGLNVARRTVAKYRESMNIPPTNLRKVHR